MERSSSKRSAKLRKCYRYLTIMYQERFNYCSESILEPNAVRGYFGRFCRTI